MDIGAFHLAGLTSIMGIVLLLPLSVKKVEEEIEIFLFIMGLIAVTLSKKWSLGLVHESIVEPIKISLTVLLAGFLFRAGRSHVREVIAAIIKLLGLPLAMAAIVFLLGLASSLITAIIAALILAEIVTALKLERAYEVRLVVYACYAIGLGAALTPLGEPLSTIVIGKLKGPPHNASFFFLFRLLGWWVIPGIAIVSAACAWKVGKAVSAAESLNEDKVEENKDICLRAAKVYLFVMALVYLGTGLGPLADRTVSRAPNWALFWINSVSAFLDNATLAAAEIVPSMGERTIRYALMGLLISGGMLIPGNIPNIISAAKLRIGSREWAVLAVPMGLALMTGYFVLLLAL
ncbi:MAG: DUF1646 family protein [Patescibacteria group bacterium]